MVADVDPLSARDVVSRKLSIQNFRSFRQGDTLVSNLKKNMFMNKFSVRLGLRPQLL